jgi:protein-S-isoprenylcysteine O-methyltransferase Ste14
MVEQGRQKVQKTLEGSSQIPWWKGARGEWYVAGQALLAVLVVFGPRTLGGWPAWVHPFAELSALAGVALFLIGGLLFATGVLRLGSNFTPVPFPKDDATLVETGPYGFVRHPMYSGAVMVALGWALLVHGWLTIGYAIALFLFFDVKSRWEEKWLMGKFSGYESYQRRVHKLIPYVY